MGSLVGLGKGGSARYYDGRCDHHQGEKLGAGRNLGCNGWQKLKQNLASHNATLRCRIQQDELDLDQRAEKEILPIARYRAGPPIPVEHDMTLQKR